MNKGVAMRFSPFEVPSSFCSRSEVMRLAHRRMGGSEKVGLAIYRSVSTATKLTFAIAHHK